MEILKLLFIGDIVGKTGRSAIKSYLNKVKADYGINLTIANGENGAGGFGLTSEVANELLNSGIDVLTSGNHIWDKKEIIPYLDKSYRVLRPLNFPEMVPGKGYVLLENIINVPILIVNLQGKVLMPPIACPFEAMDKLLSRFSSSRIVIVDFHAEATSEKRAMGFYLDGKVSLLLGTHTHIQTNDAEILPNGTGYITDVGMTGSKDSVIGMKKEGSIMKMITQMPMPLEVAKGLPIFSAIYAEIDILSGKCVKIEQLLKEIS